MDEIRRVLRVSRTTVYCMAREYRVTDGRSGIPVVEIGRRLRVPREKFEEAFGIRIQFLPDEPDAGDAG